MSHNLNFDNYLFRCSSLGKLMTGVKVGLTEKQEEYYNVLLPRFKGEGKPLTEKQRADFFKLGDQKHGKKTSLSTTTQSYLKKIHKEAMMHRSKNISSKYLDKGIRVEEKSITLYSDVKNELFVKNSKRFNDKYKTGEPDNIDRIIRDIKSSWDYETFPFYEDDIPNMDYEWQGLGYMDLTGLKEFELIYCLVDTPFSMIDDALRRLDWNHNILNNEGNVRQESISLVVETVCNMIYTKEGLLEYCSLSDNIQLAWFDGVFFEIPKEDRIKVFRTEHDKHKINALHNQIKLCREYLNNLTQIKIKQLAA